MTVMYTYCINDGDVQDCINDGDVHNCINDGDVHILY